jgi:DNA-binding CsgD family transcriptional regulator
VDGHGAPPRRTEHRRIGSWRRVALADLGAPLRWAGRRAPARDRLAAPVELAREHAAHALARRANAELVEPGARPRNPCEQAARGRHGARRAPNKEIAEAVFVTEKTVEVHLSNSDRKLAIRSRSRLARALLSRPAVAGAARGARLATGPFRAGRRGGRLL